MSLQSSAQPLLIYPSNLYDALQGIRIKGTHITDGIATLQEGTLSGLLPPTNGSDATNKAYVDSMSGGNPEGPISSIQFNYDGVSFGGSSDLTWTSTTSVLNVNGTLSSTTITASSIESYRTTSGILFTTSILSNDITATTITVGPIVANSGAITGLANLTLASDPSSAANKQYVDSKIGSNPVGPNGALQFNDGGIFGGTSNLIWNTATNSLYLYGTLININPTTQPTIFDSQTIFTNTTNSTAYNNGAIIIYGGLGVALDVNINGTCAATEYFSTSDMLLKRNIKELYNSSEILNKVKCYSYNFRGSEEMSFGLIAQQLEEIGLGSVVKNVSGHKSVNYSHFITLLIDSHKELRNELDILKKTVNLIIKEKCLENAVAAANANANMSSDSQKISLLSVLEKMKNNANIEVKPKTTTKTMNQGSFNPRERKIQKGSAYKYCFNCEKWKIESIFRYDEFTPDKLSYCCNFCV